MAARRRAIVLAAIVVGVGWSYILAVQGTTLTPHDRHAELQRIGERFAGRGPTLATEFEPYAGRWFLRRMAPEVAGGAATAQGGAERRRRAREGRPPMSTASRRRRSRPTGCSSCDGPCRQPAPISVPARLAGAAGTRSGSAGARRARLRTSASGPTSTRRPCPRAPTYGASRSSGSGRNRQGSVTSSPAVAGFDAAWPRAAGGRSAAARLSRAEGSGTARATVTVPAAGRYEVWVGGAFRGGAQVAVDGVPAGRLRHQLSYPGNWVPFGTTDVSAGPHAVTVRLDGGGLHPGTRGITRYAIGPVALRPARTGGRILALPSSAAGALCGRRLDWIEAVR